MSKQYFNLIKVQRSPLYEQIANQLEDMIVANKLQPGDRLPAERELAELLGVGRPAIREAILVLQERGLAESMPGSGTYVREATSGSVAQSIERFFFSRNRSVLELQEIREILEPELAALAAERATSEDIERMENALASIEAEPNDLDRYISRDAEFHIALVDAVQNQMLSAIYSPMVDMMKDVIREVTLRMVELDQHDPQRHRDILEPIKARRPEDASRAAREHFEGFRQAQATKAQLWPEHQRRDGEDDEVDE